MRWHCDPGTTASLLFHETNALGSLDARGFILHDLTNSTRIMFTV